MATASGLSAGKTLPMDLPGNAVGPSTHTPHPCGEGCAPHGVVLGDGFAFLGSVRRGPKRCSLALGIATRAM